MKSGCAIRGLSRIEYSNLNGLLLPVMIRRKNKVYQYFSYNSDYVLINEGNKPMKCDFLFLASSARTFRKKLCVLSISVFIFLTGCATIGHAFPADRVSAIKLEETTQDDIYATFGAPWRTGLDNGMRTWTYGHYRYSIFSEGSTEDLVIKFDRRGVVTSYVFNTTKRSK